MEYALAIMPVQNNKELIKQLDQTQHQMLCNMFGVHRTTSKANIRALTAIMPFSNRHEELRAKWGVDTLKKTPRFAVQHAHAAHVLKPLAKSCFNGLQDSALFQTLKPLGHFSERQHPDQRKNPFWEARVAYRIEQTQQQIEASSRPEAFMIDKKNNRPLQLQELSQQPDAIRRLCNLWMLGRLMGKPPFCFKCDRKVTLDHMEHSCIGRTYIDQQMRRKHFEVAARRIQHMMNEMIIDPRFLHWMTIRLGVT
jgi:hypothetical protein